MYKNGVRCKVYGVKCTVYKNRVCQIAWHTLFFLESESYSGEAVDALRAVTIIDIILSMEPIVELEEECQIGF